VNSAKKCDRMSFAVLLPISCLLNVPGGGSWGGRLKVDRSLGTLSFVVVFDGCLLNCDGCLRHQVHRMLRWKEREPFETHFRDAFKNCFFDPLLQLADGFLIHRSYPSRRATTTSGEPALDAAFLRDDSRATARLTAH
jgi:hypothetical protein